MRLLAGSERRLPPRTYGRPSHVRNRTKPFRAGRKLRRAPARGKSSSTRSRLHLRPCPEGHNRSRSVFFLSHCLMRPRIQPAFTMRSFIKCAGSARATGNFIALSYAWAKLSTIRRCCPGYRVSACRDLRRASRSRPASNGVIDWCKAISRRNCRTNPAPSTAMIWATSVLRNVDDSLGICRTNSAACHSPRGKKSSNGCAGPSFRARPTIAATRRRRSNSVMQFGFQASPMVEGLCPHDRKSIQKHDPQYGSLLRS